MTTASLAGLLLSCAGRTTYPAGESGQADLKGLTPARILPVTDQQKQIDALIDQYHQGYATRRAYIMLDKPIYQPGETIWFRSELRQTATLLPMPQDGYGVTMQLISPKGAIVRQARVQVMHGVAANAIDLPDDVQGGEYILQLVGDEGTTDRRPLIVSSYEAPRLKKTLEFVRKAYGPGDQVAAAVKVARATGEPFAKQKLTAVVMVDDAEIARVDFTTDDKGAAVVKFGLPGSIERGDGLLTILADDGGVTESVQKRIPIVLKEMQVAMFPEGGDLITGLPGRVYFTAKNSIGKPADVEGRIVDDTGREVVKFTSLHDGMGRFDLTPEKGRTYELQITRPIGITTKLALPTAKDEGCALQAIDDYDSKAKDVRVVAWCTEGQTVLAEAVLREKRIASAAVWAVPRRPTLITLPVDQTTQGALRVTLFDEDSVPVAERLIYRGRKADLKIAITADKKTYGPRDPVTLTVKATDLSGKGVEANLGVAIVDDTVLSFADDKTANYLAHVYLERELGATIEDPIEEPNFYFGEDKDAAASLDMLLGTRGWRRFEWQLVMQQRQYYGYSETTATGGGDDVLEAEPMEAPRGGARRPMRAKQPQQPQPAPPADAPVAKAPAGAKPRPVVVADKRGGQKNEKVAKEIDGKQKADKDAEKKRPRQDAQRDRGEDRNNGGAGGEGRAMAEDEEWDGDDGVEQQRWAWAPVRVFPAPAYTKGYDGPRTDFRETIHWAPEVKTDKDGTAKVTFYMSDAVTSFRVVAEGASIGGLPGRGDQVIQSKLPISLDVRLPLEVSQGDKILLPVQLTNETDHEMTADVMVAFGPAFRLGANPAAKPIKLGAGEKKTFFYPIEVVGTGGEGDVSIVMTTQGLKDEIAKKIRVVPLGFPFQASLAGTAKGGFTQKHTVDLTGALPGTITARISMYPSPLASMTQGAAAMIREPGGCFEQTSATNYPNIMVLQYLRGNDAPIDPAIVDAANGYLDRGYKILTGYESKEKGYEWFGQNPGHEALTAYGLMEFADMSTVYDDVDRAMVQRTAAWLMSRRDGKGGFSRNERALDSFGRASYETTNAYIMWALSEAGMPKGMDKELEVQRKMGLESTDPYMVALVANMMLNVDAKGDVTAKIVKRLAAMQQKDGSFTGAKQTITMSGGESLVIEATSLAVLALIKASPDNEYETGLRSGVDWLNGHRSGYGEWANTQATVLGLKTLTAYAEHSKTMQSGGVAGLYVNGQKVGEVAFEKGRKETIEFTDFAGVLKAGKNTLELKLDAETSLPYSVAIEYRAVKPASSEQAKVSVTTRLAKQTVKLGESVRLRAQIVNKSKDGVPMTLARIGLPGGLTFQTWQLKELKDKGVIGFYETHEREVILYFRALPGSETVNVDLDLMARTPGSYVAPASSAYLYYTDEDKSWADPVTVVVSK